MPSRPRPGYWRHASAFLLALSAACNYGLRGGGFPEHIRTIHVEAFENETAEFELGQQIFNAMADEIPSALGVQVGSRANADALLSGSIVGYDDIAQNFSTSGNDIDVLQHQIRINVNVRLLDMRENVILWEGRVSGSGTYAPDSETEDEGRRVAIEQIVNEVIDGAQSQW